MWAKDIEKAVKTAPGFQGGNTGERHARTGAQARSMASRSEANRRMPWYSCYRPWQLSMAMNTKSICPAPIWAASELATLLDRIPATRQLVVDMTSASGGAIESLRKTNRVVITATKTGTEKNATVFARYWAEALADPAADRIRTKSSRPWKLSASRIKRRSRITNRRSGWRPSMPSSKTPVRAKACARRRRKMAKGMLAAQFPLLRIGATAAAAKDPAKQQLLAKKEALEQQIDKLKYDKAAIPPEEYKKQLGALLLKLARTQEEIDK